VAQALILDSEAVNALAHATERAVLAERSRAILQVAHERRALVRVPAPVLAEVCRGPRFDAAIDRLLKDRGIAVCALTQSIAQRAGGLLAKAKLTSAHAVDAFVVATALEFDGAVIATGDPGDIRRLSSTHRQVKIFAL
jgi:predicted nucleic acid-binding protein